MKSFQLVTLFALFATAMAFAPNQAPQREYSMKREMLFDPEIDLFFKHDVFICLNERQK
jgi:hypothetical protein